MFSLLISLYSFHSDKSNVHLVKILGEKECSIHGGGEYWENGQVQSIVELQPDSKIRFIRKRIIRYASLSYIDLYK